MGDCISVMTPEEFAEEMKARQVEFDYDLELRHTLMDGLMMQVLTALGYGKGIDIFRDTPMWYA